ncbi:hypothetical protein PMAYCL1PPCAC_27642 [Pristionchus mayeri]|uniref:Uncharacterized protein n=1 Tax=Pristionchus mayeri TaxID=1317129 RepID=A0AAN5I9B2_9BILA|nr:hypothetical protein PMAYCL1PPCAC_27642 [Pristionchus mayeri]
MRFIITLALLVASANAQMVRQCLCTEVQGCKNSAFGSIQQCADRCQSHVTAMGGSVPAVRQCVLAQESRLRAAAACVEAAYGNSCANGPGQTVPKRFPETAQIAAFRELTGMIARSGLTAEAAPFLAAGRKAGACAGKCAQAHSCAKLGCGLALPSDSILVATGKRCAIQAGFTTPVARDICHCLANAGIKQLAPLCDRIVIS